MKNTIYFILQGKGGVGKTYISSIIYQYLRDKKKTILGIDTDPVNTSFSEYKDLQVQGLSIMENNKVNERKFDRLIETLVTFDGDIVIDNGASSFIPLSNYLVENNAIQMLIDSGKRIVVHIPITGGQALTDTLNGLNTLGKQFPEEVNLVVWINEFFGPVELKGIPFEKMKVYENNKERIQGLVRIPKKNSDTFGHDVEIMLKEKLTFSQSFESEEFSIMAKQRLKMIQKSLFGQLEVIV